MSEEKEAEGIVIDVTPEPGDEAPEEAVSESKAKAPGKGSGVSLALVLSIVALLIGIALFGAGYWLVDRARNDLASLDQRVSETVGKQAELQQAVSEANQEVLRQRAVLGEQRAEASEQRQALTDATEAFRKQEALLEDEKLRMEEREGELRAAVAEVHRRVGRSGTQWMVAEAEYLIRIANHRLDLPRDTDTATVALGLADQRLRDTQDPGWNGVRNQLARDIAALSATAKVDSAGIAARLSALVEGIPRLKLASATLGAERTLPPRGKSERKPGERNWDTLLDDIVAGFKDTVRIRRRDQPVQAMLAPEHQFFLYENLKLHIESARLALARQDARLYRDSLETAARWLEQYFDPADAATASTGEGLARLAASDIRPELPDISHSLRLLKQIQQQRDNAPQPEVNNG